MARPVSRSWGSETSCETGVIAMTDKPISPLRQRMIEDMTARHFAEKAQTDYIRYVKSFAAFLGRSPDTASAEDLRLFQQHMTTHLLDHPAFASADRADDVSRGGIGRASGDFRACEGGEERLGCKGWIRWRWVTAG